MRVKVCRLGQRARLGEGDRLVDQFAAACVDLVQLDGVETRRRLHQLPEDKQRVALPGFALLVRESVAKCVVTLMVAVVAVRLALDEARPVAGAGASDRRGGFAMHRQRVLTVDDHSGIP